MSVLVFFSFFYSYGIYIILGISFLAIIVLFFLRLKNQDDDDGSVDINHSKSTNKGIDINLKMQAYERLAILLERTDSNRLLSMIDQKEKNIDKIESNILKVILAEFEYNISQQVYVSDTLWNLIVASKNKNIILISSVKSSLKKNARGVDFFNSLKLVINNQDATPSEIALTYLKKEVRAI